MAASKAFIACPVEIATVVFRCVTEPLAAATINPAYSLRLHDRVGSLDIGKYADLAAFDVADYREIPYYFGVNFCTLTMKRGTIVHSTKR